MHVLLNAGDQSCLKILSFFATPGLFIACCEQVLNEGLYYGANGRWRGKGCRRTAGDFLSGVLQEKPSPALRTAEYVANGGPCVDFNLDRSRRDGIARACRNCLNGPGTKSDKLKAWWAARRATFVSPLKGKRMSVESRKKMSQAARRRKSNRLGRRHTPETRRKISQIVRERAARGKACHSFKDGKVADRRGQRFSAEYKRWRFDVFAKDGFVCQQCGDSRGGNLQAHHVKSFSDHPELRFVVENGITICEKCHEKTHAKVGRRVDHCFRHT